jgi:hypothetical protein
LKTEVKEQDSKQATNPFKAQDRSMLELLGYRSCHGGVLLDREGTYQAYLKIRSNDLDALANAAKIEYMDALTSIARTYSPDLKIIVATTAVDTSEQQRYYSKLLLAASQHVVQGASANWHARQELAAEVLRQVTEIGNTRNDLNFYLVVFGETKAILLKNVASLQKQGGAIYGLQMLTSADVQAVLYRLNNPNDD